MDPEGVDLYAVSLDPSCLLCCVLKPETTSLTEADLNSNHCSGAGHLNTMKVQNVKVSYM